MIAARLATALTMSWARRVLTGNAFSSAKWCSKSARTRLDIGTTRTIGLLTGGAALALEPELALLPEDVLRGEVAKVADAEPGVEQSPDDEPFGGRLAGVGQPIRLFGGERFSHVLIRHLSPSKSCVLGVGTRSHCVFQLPGYPHRLGRGRGSRPKNKGDRLSDPFQGLRAWVRDPGRKTTSRRYSNHLAELGKTVAKPLIRNPEVGDSNPLAPTDPGHHDCQLK